MEAGVLAEQFRELQLKQQERLKARVTKLQTRSSRQQPAAPPKDTADLPDCIDDLSLMTATQERELTSVGTGKKNGEDGNSADEPALRIAVQDLGQKVEHLVREKEELKRQLRESEKRAAAAQRTLEAEREALEGSPATAQKIVELSKKNRVLHAELASEKNRLRQLEKTVTRQQVSMTRDTHTRERREKEENKGEQVVKQQLCALQEQLAQSKGKVLEYSNQCQQLRQELKLAHRVITREVGEGATVSSLLGSQSGWRGRSQQIINLQNRLSEMKGLLRKTRGEEGELMCSYPDSREDGGHRVEARQRAALEKMERERRQNVESLKRELEKAQTACSELKKECSALRARNKTLTEDVKSLKSLGRNNKPSQRALDSESRVVQALEVKREKLEESNRVLGQQLRECEKALHTLKQSQRPLPSTARSEPHSLPLLHHTRQHSVIMPARQAQSAGVLEAHKDMSLLQEAQMLQRLAETERDRLAELATTLQKRLAVSEDQLVRLKTEQTTNSLPPLTKGGLTSRKQSHSTNTTTAISSESVAVLENELAIQRDENAVLRETLSQLRREKVEETKLFNATLQDTRRICVNMIKSLTDQTHNDL